MSDPGELFARLTGELEDAFGIAVEGRAAGQPPEHLHALADALATALQRACRTVEEARLAIDPNG